MVSTAIDKYIYVIVKERFDDQIYVDYSSKEVVTNINDIKHDLVREAAKLTGIINGFEVMMFADIPSEGSGLGSSSSLTVGKSFCVTLRNSTKLFSTSSCMPDMTTFSFP